MKIGFDAKRAFWNNTGLGNYSRFIISGMAKFHPEHEYSLYSPGIPMHLDLDGLELFSNVHKVNIGQGWIGNTKRAISYLDADLDLFHGLSNELPFWAKKGKTKLVVSIHDLLFMRFPNFYPALDRFIYLSKTKRACKQADLVIAISEQTKQDLIELLNVPESKIKVHYQSCHPQFWNNYTQEEINTVKEKYGIKEPYIVQVGTLENRKNALRTLQAYFKSDAKRTYQLVFLGKRTPYCELLYDFVNKNGLAEKVKFIHEAIFADFPLFYKGASLSVYPSLFEGFGIPILEAMCCGVPVITSLGGCFSEVGGGAVRYIDPLDIDSIQLQIDAILSDEKLRQELIEKGSIQAQRFTSEKLITELDTIYKDLLRA